MALRSRRLKWGKKVVAGSPWDTTRLIFLALRNLFNSQSLKVEEQSQPGGFGRCKKLTVLIIYSVWCCAKSLLKQKLMCAVCFMSHFVSSSRPFKLESIGLPTLQMSKLRLRMVKRFL